MRALHDPVSLGIDVVDVVRADVPGVLVAVPDRKGVQVQEVPRVDQSVLEFRIRFKNVQYSFKLLERIYCLF